MKPKVLDRVIVVIALLAIMITSAISVSAATKYQSTLSLGANNSFYGSLRKYEGDGNLKLKFNGSGSSNNGGQNVVEPYQRILLFDYACGYRYVDEDVDETWTNCSTGKYKFWFLNAGDSTWKSDAVYMESW
ncbi:MAG: hypothetical protein J6D52_13400 [Clostridia bacterium]|nr:hypothetical protein [Clostridia bacterium]